MGLRSLFQRKAVPTARVSPVMTATAEQDEPLPAERQDELQEAWAELTEAARGSKVTSFHACTRAGRPWTEDPAAVRAVAATLREFPASAIQ
jgi:O6-methylguanine-DNA--protein-cysteine methyltransferase